MYGGLQGLNKAETAAKHGEAKVKIWRRSYDVPPPPVELSDERWPGHEDKYKVMRRIKLTLIYFQNPNETHHVTSTI